MNTVQTVLLSIAYLAVAGIIIFFGIKGVWRIIKSDGNDLKGVITALAVFAVVVYAAWEVSHIIF